MCGICGQYNFSDERPVDRRRIETMARAIAHRGPDDSGCYFSGGLGLGFRRLSIIDVASGHQPMRDEQGSVWVAFNGEIYNFPELRVELEALGHVFRTRSDTEVIVHGYRHWGDEVLNRLNGMFGLAIWDSDRRRLVLARDPAGIKLVYYRVEQGSVVFGSELRAVLAGIECLPRVDPTALNLFLRYRYTPSPLTLYSGICKLAPGSKAVFERGDWRVRRWYRPPAPRSGPVPSVGEATDELRAIYERALKRHLLSDVPVGLLLSGGIDSGLLLALMSAHGKGWPSFSVGYGKETYADDELIDAAETARIFAAKHASVHLTRALYEKTLPRVVSLLEEPIASSSIVPMYFVCQRAREDVKVALVGQGPDELFGGYKRHLGVRYGGAWRRVPPWLRSSIASRIRRLHGNETLKRGLYSLDVDDRMRRYQNVFSILPGARIDDLFRPEILPPGAGDRICGYWSELEAEMRGVDELASFQVLEVRSSLPDELLMFSDKLSMAHGLELRVPFLDKEIFEYAHRLPQDLKVRRGQGKWLHRRVCRQYLPDEVVNRKKRGFAVDAVNSWFRDALGSKMTNYLRDPSSKMYELLEPASIADLLNEHQSGRNDHHKILFSLVVLEEWLRADLAAQYVAAA